LRGNALHFRAALDCRAIAVTLLAGGPGHGGGAGVSRGMPRARATARPCKAGTHCTHFCSWGYVGLSVLVRRSRVDRLGND
jgi:hypothetical protein